MDAEPGLVVELADGGWVGAVTRVEKQTVELEDRNGRRRVFPLGAGFLVDGVAVRLAVPTAGPARPGQLRTASGSIAPTTTGEQVRAREGGDDVEDGSDQIGAERQYKQHDRRQDVRRLVAADLLGDRLRHVALGGLACGCPAHAVTSVPIFSPRSALVMLPAGSMPKTTIGIRLSMHRLNAVESTTLRPWIRAS